MDFYANMWCDKCDRITQHYVVLIQAHSHPDTLRTLRNIDGVDWAENTNPIFVEYYRHCVRVVEFTQELKKGRIKKLPVICHYSSYPDGELIKVNDWNSLVSLAKKDHPEYW